MTHVIGVDLACARWRDVGLALLAEAAPGGLAPLPGKQKSTPADVRDAARRLARALPLAMPRTLTHDALQAVVCALPGLAIAAGRRDEWIALGERLLRQEGTWREGWVVLPRAVPQP